MPMRPMMRALRSGHWPSLLGSWLHFETSFMVWLLIGALGVPIGDEFGLSATQKGLLVGVPLLGGALLRVPVGLGSDWVGPKPVGILLLVCELAALLWGWLGATSYMDVLGIGLVLGVAGASFAVALPLASRAYPPAHQGVAMGVTASGNSGTVLSVLLAPRFAEIVGWRGVFGVMMWPVVLTMLVFAVLVRGDVGTVPWRDRRAPWDSLTDALTRRSLYRLGFLYSVTFGGFAGLCSFLPIFFHDQYGLDLVAAGMITAVCGLAGSLARPWGGYVADRQGGRAVLLLVFPAIAALTGAAGLLPSLGVAATLLVTAVAAMGFGNGIVFQVVSKRFPKQMGVASGLIGAAGGFGGFLLPSWLGALRDITGTYMSGFFLFTGAALVAVGSLLGLQQRFDSPSH